jgi:hypothetical protein
MKTTDKTEKERPPTPRRTFTGRQKSEAVLSVWSGRRKPSEACRGLGINYARLQSWQKQALEAMLQALEAKSTGEEIRGPALGANLEKLLEQASQRMVKVSKLTQRLEKIQKETAAK